jgi:Zn-dependent protease with chaperone function
MKNQLVYDSEKVYYGLCVAISLFVYVLFFISIVGIFYILLAFFITVVLHGLAIGQIQSNAVKVTKKQFPDIYSRAEKISREMGLPVVPDIYITQEGGVLNAFATSFFGRKFIVLYADIVEITKEGHVKELDFIIAHELAHIKRNHVTKNLLILPARWMPFLGKAYSRACEFTCDRMAAAYIQNTDAGANALTILAVGKILFEEVDISEFVRDSKVESGFYAWVSHLISTHPPLPIRIEKLQQFQYAAQKSSFTNAELT